MVIYSHGTSVGCQVSPKNFARIQIFSLYCSSRESHTVEQESWNKWKRQPKFDIAVDDLHCTDDLDGCYDQTSDSVVEQLKYKN